MRRLQYCLFCKQDHELQVQLDEETMRFELWCPLCVALVERVAQKDQFDRFLELSRGLAKEVGIGLVARPSLRNSNLDVGGPSHRLMVANAPREVGCKPKELLEGSPL
jgi:hypothetical protein